MDKLSESLGIAENAALIASRTALNYYGSDLEEHSKGGVDFYTLVDKRAEDAARKYIQEISEYDVFGEETRGRTDRRHLWVIDAIDGTPNFRSGIPNFGSSVCLMEDNQPIVSAIFLPVLDEMYLAEKGKGSYRTTFVYTQDTSRITTLKDTNPTKVQIAFDTGYEGREQKMSRVSKFAQEVRYMPSYGSSSFSAAKLAEGKLGGYVIFDVEVNDTAAASLLISEAGGFVSDDKGQPLTRNRSTLVAGANKEIHEFLLERLR